MLSMWWSRCGIEASAGRIRRVVFGMLKYYLLWFRAINGIGERALPNFHIQSPRHDDQLVHRGP